jgi:hypothetical protein
MLRYCLLSLLISTNTLAQTLQIGKGLVTRDDTLHGVLLLSSPLSGQGQLTLTWTDSYGRTVAVLPSEVTVSDKTVPFEFPLRQAVALLNYWRRS